MSDGSGPLDEHDTIPLRQDVAALNRRVAAFEEHLSPALLEGMLPGEGDNQA